MISSFRNVPNVPFRHFLESIQKRPKFTAALNNYATMLHHQLKRYREAEHYYVKALQIDGKYSRAHFNYANLCREHLKKYKDAEEHYLLAILNDATNPNFYNNYGLLLQYALRQYRKAKRQYEIALKLDDSHALGHCNYATILMQMVDRKYNKHYNETMDRFDDPSDNEEDEQNDPYFDDDGDLGNGSGTIPKEEYDDFVLNGGYKKKRQKSADTPIPNGSSSNKSNGNGDDHKIDVFNMDPVDTVEAGLDADRESVYSKQYSSKKEEFFTKSEWHFKKSVALNRSLVMAYNNYGCLLRRLEQHDRAKMMFAKALSIDPNFVMAKRNLDRAEQKEKGQDTYNGNGKNRMNPAMRRKGQHRTVTDDVYANRNMNDGGCLVM